MSDSDTVSQTIKWIIALVVIVVVAAGLYLVFRDNIVGFFQNLPTGAKCFLSLFKI